MTKGSFLKASLWGVGILVILNGAWLIAVEVEVFSKLLLVISQISPLIAAAVAAYFAPRNKVIVGLSMAIPSAILVVAVTEVYQFFGKPVDFPGFRGMWILFEVTLFYALFLCWIGGVVGSLIATRRGLKKTQA